MALKHETAALCAQLRRLESIPTSSNTFTDADLTELMNIELQSTIVPAIQSVREEYFVVDTDYTLQAGESAIDIPPEAVGMRLRDVVKVHTGGSISYLPRLTPEELSYGTGLYGYTVKNNQLILYPTPTAAVTIRVSFYRRPNDLTNTLYGYVISKDGSNTVTMSNIPTSWNVGQGLDLIGKELPFIGKEYNWLPTGVNTGTLEVPAEIYALITPGDYIASAGYSPVAQYIPVEAMNLLVQAAAIRSLEALGDHDGWKVATTKYTQMEKSLLAIISPRVESKSKKVIQPYNILTARKRI